jgi:hypothetical protein
MWFEFCNTGEHELLKYINTMLCLLKHITLAAELFQILEEL